MHHAAGDITPLHMLQVFVGWPWFGCAKEEPTVVKPKRKRSFVEWLWSAFGGGDKKYAPCKVFGSQ
jgi:hypothetical protein